MGKYRRPTPAHGQQNSIGFGWAFLVIAALSVTVYVVALRSRLSAADVRAQVTAVTST